MERFELIKDGSTTYLSLPLGGKPTCMQYWDVILEMIDRKLDSWKAKSLSKGGKVTLIKTVLSCLPTYMMSLYPLPASVKSMLERRMNRFFWGGTSLQRRIHFASWDKLASPKFRGGLGFKKLHEFNRALRAKWNWRFRAESEALWRCVIVAIYGVEHGNRVPKKVKQAQHNSLWKDIMKHDDQTQSFCAYKVGNGLHTRFWLDPWASDRPLQEMFPGIFNKCVDPNGLVADRWCENVDMYIGREGGNWAYRNMNGKFEYDVAGDGGIWRIITRHRIRRNEDQEMILLLELLAQRKLIGHSRDTIVWRLSSQGTYTVKSMYEQLIDGEPEQNLTDVIWMKGLPPKISVFLWLTLQNRLPTLDVMRTKVWLYSFGQMQIFGPVPGTLKDVIELSFGSSIRKESRKMRKIFIVALLWQIWKHRNGVHFNNIRLSKEAIWWKSVVTSFLWCKFKLCCINVNIHEFATLLKAV